MGAGGVLRIEVTERERPVFGGTEFGAVGHYERLHGTISGELDPTHPLNVGIVNLDRAARNAHVVLPTEPAIGASLATSQGRRKRAPSFPRPWRILSGPVG